MENTKQDLKKDTESVYSLVQKGVLSPHEFSFWISSILKSRDREIVELRKRINEIMDDWVK